MDGWWKSNTPGDCSNEDLERFLDKVLTVQLPEFGNGTTEIGTVSELHALMGIACAYWLFMCVFPAFSVN